MVVNVKNAGEIPVKGVRFAPVSKSVLLQKEHFEWTSFPLETGLKTNRVVSGLLKGWHRTVEFDTVEYHEDTENFFFMEGECIMPFCDQKQGEADMDTMQLIRILPGTQVEVQAGKCHYVPIPLTDCFRAYVFTPLQESVLISLKETVKTKEGL
ncbi:MAG: hypothetical protein HFH25_00585 [Lachnospiraceae bacterium]|nr:hypothetical protein [Lachnospiraceae bacterium]